MKVQTNQTTGGEEEEVREAQQSGTLGIVVSVTMTTKLATMNRWLLTGLSGSALVRSTKQEDMTLRN